MLKFMKTLLGIENKSKSLEENIPNLLAAMGRTIFLLPEDLKEIKKLKLSREDTNMVCLGLTGLGMCLTLEATRHSVHRVVLDRTKVENIIQQIMQDTQAAFYQQVIDDGVPLNYIANIDTLIPALFDDLANYMLNPQESFPGNTWGILSIALWRVFGEQKAHGIITEVGYFEYMRIRVHFDARFVPATESFFGQDGDIANQIDQILCSPMGNQYGIT